MASALHTDGKGKRNSRPEDRRKGVGAGLAAANAKASRGEPVAHKNYHVTGTRFPVYHLPCIVRVVVESQMHRVNMPLGGRHQAEGPELGNV